LRFLPLRQGLNFEFTLHCYARRRITGAAVKKKKERKSHSAACVASTRAHGLVVVFLPARPIFFFLLLPAAAMDGEGRDADAGGRWGPPPRAATSSSLTGGALGPSGPTWRGVSPYPRAPDLGCLFPARLSAGARVRSPDTGQRGARAGCRHVEGCRGVERVVCVRICGHLERLAKQLDLGFC
jgi:hypothetical protein